MRSRSSLSRASDGKNALIAVVIVLVLLVSSLGAFMFLSGGSKTAQKGDTVKVNYIGKIADGRVFDTSMHSVAVDNATYPKSLAFGYRGNESTYTPYEFTLGSSSTLTKFSDGIVGMRVGETRTMVIPAGEGYPLNESLLTTFNLTEKVPVQKTMSIDDFEDRFGTTPTGFMIYTDPEYGWNVQVLFIDNSDVRLMNNVPVGGSNYRAYASSTDASYGWDVNVTYDSGGDNLIVHHLLTASSAGKVVGENYDGSNVFVDSVDVAAGTAVLNKNSYGELAGKEISFVVTLVSIE